MLWPILSEKAREQKLPLSTVVPEVLHLIVLDTLFAVPESQSICFQGGTSIHLLYGGYPYSEDLDFTGENINAILVQGLISRSQSNVEKTVIQFLGPGQCEWRFPSVSPGGVFMLSGSIFISAEREAEKISGANEVCTLSYL